MHSNLESLSTSTLRTRARKLGWRVKFWRNFNRIAGNDCFVIIDSYRNHIFNAHIATEDELRGWLIDTIRTGYQAG